MKISKGVLSVGAGAFIMLMLGAAYVWGVYKQPISDAFGCSRAAATMPFSVSLAFYTLGMMIGGKLQDKYGPTVVCTVGAGLFGAGYFFSGFAANLWQLTISYGAVAGLGTGLAYLTPVAAGTKWFPSKKGLISGIIIFGFGAGAFLLSPLAGKIVAEAGWRVSFKVLGAIFFVAGITVSRLVTSPRGLDLETADRVAAVAADKPAPFESSPSELLRKPLFYALWTVWFLCLATGLGTMAHLVAHALKEGVDPVIAAMSLSVIAIFNGAGRVFFGAMSDKLGRMWILVGASAMMAAVSAGFAAIEPAAGMTAIYILGAGFGLAFGSILVLYPAVAADFFGQKNLGSNYGLLFSSYGAGGIVGPVIYGRIFDAAGSYTGAFALGAAAAAAATVVAVWVGLKTGFSTS